MGLKEDVLKRGWLTEKIGGVEVSVLGFLNNQWHTRELCYWAADTRNLDRLRGKKILDVGSGHGYVPIYFKKLGLDITAAEHAPFPLMALELAIENAGLEIPIVREWITPEMTDDYDVVLVARVFWEPDEVVNNMAILQRVRERGGMAVMVSGRVSWGEHPTIKKEDLNVDFYPTPTGVDVMELK